ncbi:class I SAM-dependent methyltransferase [Thermodesulfobacteriota bacterium]
MGRFHFIEIEDTAWCPQVIRDGVTDFLRFFINSTNGFAAIVPRLGAALEKTGTDRIVDLCSGGTGPWLQLERQFADRKAGAVKVCLTDKYPNIPALTYYKKASGGMIDFYPEPVDAAGVPEHLKGFRTIFSAFHHFRPEQARALIRDAVRQRCGIAVVDGVCPRIYGVLLACVSQFMLLVVTLLMRPFKLSRLFFTYLLPLIPFVLLFDGIVSALRVYTPAELEELVAEFRDDDYIFEIGTEPVGRLPFGPTYLIGYPRGAAQADSSREGRSDAVS